MNPNLTVSYMAIVTERRSLDNRAARGCLATEAAANPSATTRFVGPRQFVSTALASAKLLVQTTNRRRFAPKPNQPSRSTWTRSTALDGVDVERGQMVVDENYAWP